METYFATPERNTAENIFSNHQYIKDQPNITKLLDSFPNPILILDDYRQIVFFNKAVYDLLEIDYEAVFGKRPGELIGCIHSTKMEGGCGTSKNCRFCGAVNSILESQATGRLVTKDFRITTRNKDVFTYNEYAATSSTLEIGSKKFTLFTLEDISSKKRREVLEKIFFHDLINTAGSLSNLLYLLNTEDFDGNKNELIDLASRVSVDLIDEISAQKMLLEAENGELVPLFKTENSLSVLQKVVESMKHHAVATGKNIIIDINPANIDFETDITMLRRVLINMVKNALEATRTGQNVVINATRNDNMVAFSVHNPSFILPDIQLQIFQRSFSTKAVNRGVGTYSMKLLTEQYLKGRVYFTSDKESGTRFYCELPIYNSGASL